MSCVVDKQWFIEQFDRFVAENTEDGAELDLSRKAVARAYAEAVESGAILRVAPDLETEGCELFDRSVGGARNKRRQSMRQSAQVLLDALHGATLVGALDPVLAQAFPLGDGRDKTLRYWSRDDWASARTERYRNAAEATRAAQVFDVEIASEFIAEITRRGVRTTGALFDPPQAAA